jgi:hypothetical protein
MWRHITGVEQPAKKIQLDNNEKLERKRTTGQTTTDKIMIEQHKRHKNI